MVMLVLKIFVIVVLGNVGLPVPEGFALGTAFSRLHLSDPEGAAAALRPALRDRDVITVKNEVEDWIEGQMRVISPERYAPA